MPHDLITLGLYCLRDFQDRSFAESLIKQIISYPGFEPTKFAMLQPLKHKYNPDNINLIVDTLLNETENSETKFIEARYASGGLIIESRKKGKMRFSVRWEKRNKRIFNYIGISVDRSFLLNERIFKVFLDYIKELAAFVKPVKGEISNWAIALPDPFDLKVIHPELQWCEIFGAPYIKLFGREKLLSAPCYYSFEYDELIFLQLTENPFLPIPEEVRIGVKKHLGEKAFVKTGESARDYEILATSEDGNFGRQDASIRPIRRWCR